MNYGYGYGFVDPFAGLLMGAIGGEGSVEFDWLDTFSDIRAALAVHGTPTTPAGGTRAVTDTEGNLAINGSAATYSPKSSPVYNDPGMRWTPTVSRVPGKMVVFELVFKALGAAMVGFDTNLTSNLAKHAILFSSDGSVSLWPENVVVGVVQESKVYRLTLALRSTGAFLFIQGGAYTEPTLLAISDADTTATLYAGAITNIGSFDLLLAGAVTDLWLPEPLVSDGFSDDVSDGLGHAEGVAGGLGAGGAGIAWADDVGTWQVAGGVADPLVASGGLNITTVELNNADGVMAMDFTRSAGSLGLVLRYVDTNNYLRAVWDGTTASFIETIGGTDNVLFSKPVASAARLQVYLHGNTARFRMGNTLVGAGSMNAGAPTGTKHGLYSTSVDNTFDNFVGYARK